jgi:uncharacterized membrane protein (UPF0182 family)
MRPPLRLCKRIINYHMTDPQVFYNQEDLWTLPQEKYNGQAVAFQPYYILMRLPETDEIQSLERRKIQWKRFPGSIDQ